jgi:hypothetical protein
MAPKLPLLSRLWVAGIKESTRVAINAVAEVKLTEEAKTLSAGVFSPRLAPLLTTCTPLFTRAASELIRTQSNAASKMDSDSENHAFFPELLPLTLLQLAECVSPDGDFIKDTTNVVSTAAALSASLTPKTVTHVPHTTFTLILDCAALLVSHAQGSQQSQYGATQSNVQHLRIVEAGLDLLVHLSSLLSFLPSDHMDENLSSMIAAALVPIHALFIIPSSASSHHSMSLSQNVTCLEPLPDTYTTHGTHTHAFHTGAAARCMKALAKMMPACVTSVSGQTTANGKRTHEQSHQENQTNMDDNNKKEASARTAIAAVSFVAMSCLARLRDNHSHREEHDPHTTDTVQKDAYKDLSQAAIGVLIATDDAICTHGDEPMCIWGTQLGKTLTESLLHAGTWDTEALLQCLMMSAPRVPLSAREEDDECGWSACDALEARCVAEILNTKVKIKQKGCVDADPLRAVRACIQSGIGGKLPANSPRLALLHRLLARIAPVVAQILMFASPSDSEQSEKKKEACHEGADKENDGDHNADGEYEQIKSTGTQRSNPQTPSAAQEYSDGDAKMQCEAVRMLLLCHATAPTARRGEVLVVALPLLVSAMMKGADLAKQLSAASCTAIAQSDTATFKASIAALTTEEKINFQQAYAKLSGQ